jgi:sigma-B regulation protein RsbU (phosphoserine phosphatase)
MKRILLEHAGNPLDIRIGAVISRLKHASRKRHDDITILALEDPVHRTMKHSTANRPEPVARMNFPAQAEELQRVREFVQENCIKCGCTPALTQDLVIAIGEACQNVVRHAYKDTENGRATLEIHCNNRILEFRLLDTAPPVDRNKVRPRWPVSVQPGGLGLCLIHDIMDKVEYLPSPTGKGNLLRMVKFFKRTEDEA